MQIPACEYALDYTFWVRDSTTGVYSTLPSFVTELDKTFTVVSTDPSGANIYQVVARANVPSGYPVFEEELIINLAVSNACLSDEVTATATAISDFSYYLQNDGLLSWSPTWSSTVDGCPTTFEIGRVFTGVEQALTSHETAALTHSDGNGSLTLLSTD